LNVLLVMADDLRADLLPFMPFTNGLLRRSGTEFTSMRCNVPMCGPVRVGLLTGQLAIHNGSYTNLPNEIPNPAVDSLPVWLAPTTASRGMFGKYPAGYAGTKQPGWDTWGVLSAKDYNAYGYSYTDGTTTVKPPQHQLTFLADQVSDFVATAAEPFFCWYAPTTVHVVPPKYVHNPLPDSIDRFWWLSWDLDLLTDEHAATKPSWIRDRAQLSYSTQSFLRHNIRQQVRVAHDLDGAIAQVHQALDDAGRLDDTLIIFTSDSGVFYGEQRQGYGFCATKDHPYDAVARVPFLITGPGVPANEVVTAPSVLQDVTATILSALGATATVPQDGLDLFGVMATPDAARVTLYERGSNSPDGPNGAGIVTATRKLIRWTGVTGTDEYEMYDLDTDPRELSNVGDDVARRSERDLLETELDLLLAS
jgi:arylsulfatase A-like enzyme